MKKRLLTALAVSLGIYAHAQTEKGKTIIGGAIGFASDKTEVGFERKTSSFSIGPSVGYFIVKNAALGLGLEYSTNKNTAYSQTMYFDGLPYTIGTSGSKGQSIGISPFFRYYFDLNEKVKLFGQVNTGIYFGSGKTLQIDGTEEKNGNSTSYLGSIQPGIAFFPHKKIAVELKVPLLSYFHQKQDAVGANSIESKYNHLSFGSDLAKPILGINFHF